MSTHKHLYLCDFVKLCQHTLRVDTNYVIKLPHNMVCLCMNDHGEIQGFYAYSLIKRDCTDQISCIITCEIYFIVSLAQADR